MLNFALAILLVFDLATAFRAYHVGERDLLGLTKRQGSVSQCPAVTAGPNLCARSCGPGFILCPGAGVGNCFNPGRGDSCCGNGWHCEAGSYCANFPDGSVNCCFNNQTLSQCGAVAKGVTIAGGSSSVAPSSSSSHSPGGGSSIASGGGSSIAPGGNSSVPPGGGSSASPGGSRSIAPGGRSSHNQPSSPPSNPVPSSSGSVVCKPVKNPTCERSCGPGWITCQELPNCYNPSLGQTCCSDGTWCPVGSSCVPGGCCPDGQQCGGSASSAINVPPSQITIPGGQVTGTPNAGSPTSSQAASSAVLAGKATTDFHLALDAVAILLTAFGVLLL